MTQQAAASTPDAAMMAAPEALARFLETLDARLLDGVFSAGEVTILENFAPHVFLGQEGLARWRGIMTGHVGAIGELRHEFGAPQDFALTDEIVYFTLPTHWTGVRDGRRFEELGGWSFVQAREDGGWRVRSYGWAVVSFDWLD
ncbi:hypothetical protein CFHF_24195 [Caulobacter flavus]|uniref:SnoaL-like domain-containing protein n=1 Tax=Caulobacter flavus TaxID=1679497 RepID=A0A2N5CMA3_9CAUL|nr:hypothetical protein [Caulobacter flavus]AYV48061.1 hypothetical protein C1707_18355 [Caulobacter flavus]PLR07015.1 hypothetical protein CFHF_24195 [Caulobacter flavus]